MPNIFNVWADEGWEEPIIEERFDPDRTVLTLSFIKKQAIKASDKKQAIKASDKKQAIKTSNKKQAIKTQENIEKIRDFLEQNGESKASDIAEYIGLSVVRTRALLSDMPEVEPTGANRNRVYRIRG